jgi:hypothetical protein
MRHYKKLNIAFAGFIPREFIAEEFTRATRTQLGARPMPEVDTNITFQADPLFTNRFMAQLNFRSCYEKKVIRIMEQNGGKIVALREDLHQRGQEETDNTSIGKQHSFENVDELIQHGSFA